MAENSNSVNSKIVRGVLFSAADYLSIEAWRDAGYPTGVTVRDTPYWLQVSLIPITDAVQLNCGRWVRGKPIFDPPKKLRKVMVSKIAIPHSKVKHVDWPNMQPHRYLEKETK